MSETAKTSKPLSESILEVAAELGKIPDRNAQGLALIASALFDVAAAIRESGSAKVSGEQT